MKRAASILLSVFLVLQLSLSALATAETQDTLGIEITWLALNSEPAQYIPELDCLVLMDDSVVERRTGKKIKYDGINGFSEGHALVWKYDVHRDRKYGFIDETGDVTIALNYDDADSFSEGLAAVAQYDTNGDKKYGFIDENGEIIVPLEYDYAGNFSEGLANVCKEDTAGKKYGFIDKTGKVVIPLEYDYAYSFSEGLASIRKSDANGEQKCGYIDKKGEIVLSVEYDGCGSFSEGIACVSNKNAYGISVFGFIDRLGGEVLPCEYNVTSYNTNYDLDLGPIVWAKKSTEFGIFINPYYTPDQVDDTQEIGFPTLYIATAVCISAAAVATILKRVHKNVAKKERAER